MNNLITLRIVMYYQLSTIKNQIFWVMRKLWTQEYSDLPNPGTMFLKHCKEITLIAK